MGPNLVSPARSPFAVGPFAGKIAVRSQRPFAKSVRSIRAQTSCDLTDPFAVLRSHRSHCSQPVRANRGPFAASKKTFAADCKEFTCLKSCILQHLSFGIITNPWESEQLASTTLYFTHRNQYLWRFGQDNPYECAMHNECSTLFERGRKEKLRWQLPKLDHADDAQVLQNTMLSLTSLLTCVSVCSGTWHNA